jgi:hypothetical protein
MPATLETAPQAQSNSTSARRVLYYSLGDTPSHPSSCLFPTPTRLSQGVDLRSPGPTEPGSAVAEQPKNTRP